MTEYLEPVPLNRRHDLSRFVCRSVEQTEWLREHARQAHASGTAKVFVATTEDETSVIAYYAWCMTSLKVEDAPARLRQGAGKYPQPMALLARLGVDLNHEKRGLGAGLVTEVLLRTAATSEQIGCRGLLIHCESEDARTFYVKLLPSLQPSPTDPLHLVMLTKDVRATLAAMRGPAAN